MSQHSAARVIISFAILFAFAFVLVQGGPDLSSPALVLKISTPAPQKIESAAPTIDAKTHVVAVAKPVARTIAPVPSKPLPQLESAQTTSPEAGRPDVHVVKRGESVTSIARTWISRTSYMTIPELESAIREANGLKTGSPKPGDALVIPGYEPGPFEVKSVPRPRDFEVQAIYLTGAMAGSDNGIRLIRRWRDAGGNAIVFDIKDGDGSVNVPFHHPLLQGDHRPAIRNLPKFIRFLHQNGLHAIARIALFRDEHIAQHHSELAVHSRRTGEPWRENGKLVWSDPSNPEMQDYDLALAKYVAGSGADEIQFDYVRFPAEGDQKDAQFAFEKTHPDWKRADVIADFLARAYKELHQNGVLLSLDVFGIMAWQRSVDLAHTGQDIVQMAKHCDVLSPMIYPSHFFGMDGYETPGDAPEHFITSSMERFEKITEGSKVVLRPWLQAFAWRTKTYSPAYIETQVSASKLKGGIGFLFWNARNDYAKPFAAMPEMRAKPARFFRIDAPPVPATKTTAGQ
jgi:hypothetical protein